MVCGWCGVGCGMRRLSGSCSGVVLWVNTIKKLLNVSKINMLAEFQIIKKERISPKKFQSEIWPF